MNLYDPQEDTIDGYDMGEVEDLAADLFATLSEQGTTVKLSLLALCRAITLVGAEPADLDSACRYIDEFSEIPLDNTIEAVDLEDEEGEV